MIADANDQIPNRKAVELLLRKGQNSKALGDMGGLPKDWSSFSRIHYEKLVRNLDIYHSGSIDCKVLAICCILLKSPLPTDNQIESFKRTLGQMEISSECLQNAACWFDETESAKDRDYSHPFPRTQLVKEILFDLFVTSNGIINVPKFTQVLKVSEIKMLKQGVATYGDILTSDINK